MMLSDFIFCDVDRSLSSPGYLTKGRVTTSKISEAKVKQMP